MGLLSKYALRSVFVCSAFLAAAWPACAQQANTTPPTPIGPRGCGGLYPTLSRSMHEEGIVTVSATIQADGTLRDLHVEKTSGQIRLDEAALACVSAWTYLPAKRDGVAVETAIHPEITWKLDGPSNAVAQKAQIEDLSKSLAEQPQNIDLLLKRADLYMATSQSARAIEDYDHVLLLARANAGTYLVLARAHAAIKGDDPLETLNRGLAAFPRDVLLLKARADLYMVRSGAMDNARADFETVLSIAPGDSYARYMLYVALKALRREAEALPHLDTLLQSEQDNPSVVLGLIVRSQRLLKEKQYIAALADLDRLAKLRPAFSNFNDRCFFRAVANIELEKAVEYCEQGLRVDPQDADLMDSQAFAYFRMGKFAEARDMYGKALRIDSKMPSALYVGGLAKKRLGEPSGDADIAAGKRLESGIAERYAGYGVTQ